MSREKRELLVWLLSGALGALGCGGMVDAGMAMADDVPPVPAGEHPAEPEPCTTGLVCFDGAIGAGMAPLTLGAKTTLNTSVVLSRQAMGQALQFSVVTDVPTNDLAIEITPKQLPAGMEANIPLAIDVRVPTGSAFDGGKPIVLRASVMGPTGASSDSKSFMVPIEPRLVVEYSGKGGNATPHTWTIPGNDPLRVGAAGAAGATPVRLRKNGVRVTFVNKDTTASHVLHCSGPIPHQQTNMPSAPNAAYNPLVTTAGTASCYDHNLESQSVAVYFQFMN